MLIKINGEEIDVAEGSSIQDVIEETNAPYTPGSIVCLIKGKKELEKNISKYKIKTTQGSIILQLDESDEAKPLVDVWKNQYEEFVDLDIRWSTPTEVAIGPVVTDLEPTHDEFKYFEGDVVLSLSSFSNESTHLIMLKENTTNVYGVPPFNKGIFARVIGGKKTLDNLTDDDKVTGIEPIIERSTTTDSASVSDLSIVLEEGNELYTYISFEIDENSAVSSEAVRHAADTQYAQAAELYETAAANYTYKPAAAAAYADKYWKKYNRSYKEYRGVDCANFVSQCLYAGGMPKTSDWYPQSVNWINVMGHIRHFKEYGAFVTAGNGNVLVGNPVYYDWNGNGTYDHTGICVGKNASGMPVVDAHTNNVYHVPWSMGSRGKRATIILRSSVKASS